MTFTFLARSDGDVYEKATGHLVGLIEGSMHPITCVSGHIREL